MRGKKGHYGADTINKGLEMDLRLRIKSESDIHSKFKQLQKDNEWTGQTAAMHIFRSYFNKPVLVAEPIVQPKAVAVAKAKPVKRFVKPSLIEIQQEFEAKGSFKCLDDGESFFNHYESNGWKVGKSLMKNWKAAVANWHKRNKEGNNNGKDQSKAISGRDAITFKTTDF